MAAPTKINTGNTRPVNRTDVLKADDPSVEREQLNRILKRIAERLDGVELAVASGGDSGNSDFVLLVNATQLDYEDGFLSIAPGGVGTTELASSAVTTIKIDDEAVTTAKIDDEAVTFAKMQNIATDRLVGRDTASSGSPEEIAVGGGLEFTGSAGIQRSALTGDITAPAGDNTTTLATVNADVGTFGSASQSLTLTINAKGLVTAASANNIAIDWSAISGTPTTLAGYGITDAQAADATLTALAAANWAANAVPIGTGADTLSQTLFAANTFPARASTGDLVAKSITDFGLSLVDDADAAAGRTTLGLGTAATADTGTSGATVPFLNGNNTWAGTNSFQGNVTIGDASGDTLTIAPNAITWSNNPTHSGDHTFSASWYRSGVSTPSQITTNPNNYTLAANIYAVRLSTDASREMRGMAPTGGHASGRELLLINVGSFDLILKHDNANASAVNRFLCPNSTDLTLNPNDNVRVWYDITSQRWRVIGV